MNGILKYLLLIIVGILIGVAGMYFVNENATSIEVEDDNVDLQNQLEEIKPLKKNEIKTKPIHESNFIEDTVVSLQEDSLPSDSLVILDTLGYSDEEYLDIVSERLVAQRNVLIQLIQPDSLDPSDMLNLKADSYSKNISVEFWESPLDLIGYELSRSRLKLFGFNSDESILIKRNYDSEKLIVQIGPTSNSVLLSLEKSPKFKSIILK